MLQQKSVNVSAGVDVDQLTAFLNLQLENPNLSGDFSLKEFIFDMQQFISKEKLCFFFYSNSGHQLKDVWYFSWYEG